jgi:DNA modification methylase
LETIKLPTSIEQRPIGDLLPFTRNSRTHSEAHVAQVAASIVEFGWTNPVLVGADGVIIAGHARVLAARKLGLAEVPVIVLGHLSETQRRALVIADNKLAMNAGWDEEILREEMQAVEAAGFDLDLVGFSDEEIRALMADAAGQAETAATEAVDEVPEPPVNPVTRAGDIWVIGRHRLICGDCRDLAVVKAVLNGAAVNVAITSPPYATQREYDPSSGFKPIPPDEYVDWFRAVAGNVQAVLAADGSWLVNIKAHAENGERHLYTLDLVIAHKRQWGWRYVDEFCWRKTDNGVPGGWPNRFKNAWEPVHHFSRQADIKFNALACGTASDYCFDYSPHNPKSASGSGLLGTGPRGAYASQPPKGGQAWGHMRKKMMDGKHEGIARPSNVIECTTESSQGSHSAPFPRPLVEFFVKSFSDAGDAILDPFTGSGTTMAAAHVLDRVGYGCEISPAYCDVILRRIGDLAGVEPVLAATGQTIAEVAAERGVPNEQVDNPRLRDTRRIQHHGAAPFYGSRKAN